LKAFLQQPDGVDLYKDVTVNYIAGKKAVLTIYNNNNNNKDDETEIEKITLSDYNDKTKLHDLFNDKGFTKYTQDEINARRKIEELHNGKEKHRLNLQDKMMKPTEHKLMMKDKMRDLIEARKQFEAGIPDKMMEEIERRTKLEAV
jgi:hypothetical protein